MYIMRKKQRSELELSVEELQHAERDIIRLVQTESFPNVLKVFSSGGAHDMLKGTGLEKLCPMLIDGMICVGGRLDYSNNPERMKHPIILPKNHVVTELIIKHYHDKEGHSGTMHVLSAIREKYWILRGGATVKRVIGRCIICRRYSAKMCQQLMAPLPTARVEPGWYPFQHVGIDYFGPFLVKRGRGTEKRYGCIFTCLQTRAVHLEVAYALTTDSFILVLMRFIGRRGCPSDIYSDNGTNFVGACRELRDIISMWDERKLCDHLTAQGVRWHFQPPASSHRGGAWERLIRSVRKILFMLCKEQSISDEVLVTLMVEAERILNNRPLVPASFDCKEEIALTPNHLLLLRCNTAVLEDITQNYNRGWRQASYLAGVFWRRWMREYLPILQVRQKWCRSYRNLKVGDLVLISSDGTSRNQWPLGIIEECHPSKDGLVRQVSVRSRGNILRRDIRSLCLLEGECLDNGSFDGLRTVPRPRAAHSTQKAEKGVSAARVPATREACQAIDPAHVVGGSSDLLSNGRTTLDRSNDSEQSGSVILLCVEDACVREPGHERC